jgi:hypothetical protein
MDIIITIPAPYQLPKTAKWSAWVHIDGDKEGIATQVGYSDYDWDAINKARSHAAELKRVLEFAGSVVTVVDETGAE